MERPPPTDSLRLFFLTFFTVTIKLQLVLTPERFFFEVKLGILGSFAGIYHVKKHRWFAGDRVGD